MRSKELFLLLVIIWGTHKSPALSQPADAHRQQKSSTEWYEVDEAHLSINLYHHLDSISDSLSLPDQEKLRRIQNKEVLKVGERLVFDLKFSFFHAGVGIFEIPDTINVNGQSCYQLVSKAISNPFVSTFYPVRDILLSLVDAEGLYPIRFEKHLREGDYKNDYWVFFDHVNSTAYWQDTTFSITQYAQDVISSLYYIRTFDISPGKEIIIDCHTDRKNYPLKIVCHKKQKIKVKAGVFDCVKVEPHFRTEGLFKKKGRLMVWLTDDKRHMPVKMKSKIYFIGSITGNLISYREGS